MEVNPGGVLKKQFLNYFLIQKHIGPDKYVPILWPKTIWIYSKNWNQNCIIQIMICDGLIGFLEGLVWAVFRGEKNHGNFFSIAFTPQAQNRPDQNF